MSEKIDKKIEDLLDKIIRVDLAGEFGAKQIYKGQILASKPNEKALLEELLSSELVHLEYFERLGREHQVRPTIMHPIWKFSAFAMGFLSGKAGNNCKMACTVGVEEVIFDHYMSQVRELDDILKSLDTSNRYWELLIGLRKILLRLAEEEKHHGEIGIENGDPEAISYKISKKVSSILTKLAIKISERI